MCFVTKIAAPVVATPPVPSLPTPHPRDMINTRLKYCNIYIYIYIYIYIHIYNIYPYIIYVYEKSSWLSMINPRLKDSFTYIHILYIIFFI